MLTAITYSVLSFFLSSFFNGLSYYHFCLLVNLSFYYQVLSFITPLLLLSKLSRMVFWSILIPSFIMTSNAMTFYHDHQISSTTTSLFFPSPNTSSTFFFKPKCKEEKEKTFKRKREHYINIQLTYWAYGQKNTLRVTYYRILLYFYLFNFSPYPHHLYILLNHF